ncbi:MAG: Hpt domain-containing protein [Planctomycetota bacterium]
MSEPQAAGSPIYSEFRSDEDMAELVELFVEDMQGRIDSMTSALDAQDWAQLTTLAHQLKGASGGYGFGPVGEAAAKLEHTLRAGDFSDVDRLRQETDDLIGLCRRVRA